MKKRNIIVQGERGCFHQEAAAKYFVSEDLAVHCAHSFPQLAEMLVANPTTHMAIVAIENSIAGSLLDNYRILRENDFQVIGEVYLRIRHHLMALPGQDLFSLREVHSHPMAIKQCLDYLSDKDLMLIESADTALSAKHIREKSLSGIGAIASEQAAELYDLEVLAEGIETSKVNYTRFFIVQTREMPNPDESCNKASIYLRLHHAKGSLLQVLSEINDLDINLSKLQSYPVLGEMATYYFHLDLEFDRIDLFDQLLIRLRECTKMVHVLGTYTKANFND